MQQRQHQPFHHHHLAVCISFSILLSSPYTSLCVPLSRFLSPILFAVHLSLLCDFAFYMDVCMFYFSLVRSFASHFLVGGQDSCHSSIHFDPDTDTSLYVAGMSSVYTTHIAIHTLLYFLHFGSSMETQICNSLESLRLSVHEMILFLGHLFFFYPSIYLFILPFFLVVCRAAPSFLLLCLSISLSFKLTASMEKHRT